MISTSAKASSAASVNPDSTSPILPLSRSPTEESAFGPVLLFVVIAVRNPLPSCRSTFGSTSPQLTFGSVPNCTRVAAESSVRP
ncbi:MAG: hypothetical protein U5N53_14080 [Mycobacterium sp.]|nr:hypothetical protein [Mycobacterium sp.]